MRNPGGYLLITAPEGPAIERDTFSCCHCNAIVVVKPGSGITRGWCGLEGKPHCGGERCWPCVPFERRLEVMERRARFRSLLG